MAQRELADRYAYRVLWSDEDEEFVGLCAEFPSLSHLAGAPTEALEGIRALVRDVVAEMRETGSPIPEPLASREYTGHYPLRMTPQLHRRLAIEAAEQRVSLNRLLNTKLAQ